MSEKKGDAQIIAETRLKWALAGISEADVLAQCVPPTAEELADLAWVEAMKLAGPRKKRASAVADEVLT